MKYLVTSDIHLGHKNTPTEHIANSFRKNILSKSNIDIDVLFISGDLFDRLLDVGSKELLVCLGLFNDILNFCYDNNITLRVLAGTPSHDWSQPNILVKLNDIRVKKCDLIYHSQLDIEYISKINKHVLYIPDEWTNDHSELESQIKEKLDYYNISKVDIGIFHGQFKYQLLGKPYKGFYFQEDYFLSIVNNYIHVGHYHTYSTFDRIIANGSLERLAHGEEDPKGYIVVNDTTASFIHNTNAYIYKTIKITPSFTIDKLDKIIYKYPKNSFIRLLVNREHDFNIIFSELKLRYLDYNIKKQIKESVAEDNTITYIIDDTSLEFSDKFVLENNIHQTLMNIINSKYKLNRSETSKLVTYIDIFKEIIHEPNIG